MAMMHLGLLMLIDFADLTLGMLLLHAFTFDPAWIPPKKGRHKITIFYDGHCGLCHGSVRFVLAEARNDNEIFFSPLEGESFDASVPKGQRAGLPDSVVLKTSDGRLLVRSAAVFEIAQRLGGLWRAVGVTTALIPRPFLDFVYDAIARLRRHIFAAPPAQCPLLPPDLRGRFQP
jgi:predicted DCC family thiol-disulfide oxidoreductase YuxK